MNVKKPGRPVASYVNLRRIVGVIGVLLWLVLLIGFTIFSHKALPYSVSSYYYSPMRNVLVASLCVLGVFLVAYKGYDTLDTSITNVAGAATIGVAFFPTSNPGFKPTWVGDAHPWLAGLAMFGMFLMALQFTQTGEQTEAGEQGRRSVSAEDIRRMVQTLPQDCRRMARALLFSYEPLKADQPDGRRKNARNRIYSGSAWVILVSVVLAFVQNFWPKSVKDGGPWLFIFEALAMVGFGVAWLVKGETIFKDHPAALAAP